MAQELTLIVRAEDRASQVLKTLQVNVKQTVTVTKTATAANKAVGRSALTASKGINSMAASTRRMITAVAGASVMYAMVRGVRAATKEYVEYNKQLHNVWTLTDYTGEKLGQLGTRVRHLAMDFNVTASESLKAMYQIYSATFYGESAFLILEESLKGAAAGLSDVFTVADMMTTVLNAYNMEASEVAHINDVLFTTIKYGKTTMHELAMQFGRLAGVAAPMGAGIEELSAAIATLTKRGITTDWAITALRQSIMQIMRPSTKLEAVIKKLGYTTGTQMLKAHGFAESLNMINQEAKKSGTGLEVLFANIRAVMAVLPLGTTAAKDYAENLERFADVEGAAAEAFRKQTEAIWFQLGVLSTGLKDLGAIAAEVFMHDMAIYIKDNLVPIVKTLAFYIAMNREELNYFIKGAAKVIGVVMMIYGLSKGFWLLTKPIIWLIAAAGLLYAVWETNLYGIRDIVDSVGESLDAVITWGLDMVGLGAMTESVKGWSNGLKVAMLAGAGLGLSRFLISALFKVGKGGFFTGASGLTMLNIGLVAAMAWDIKNKIGNIEEPGVAGSLTSGVFGAVLGAILGVSAAVIAGMSVGWIVPIAAAGYVLGLGVKMFMDVVWDVGNGLGDVEGLPSIEALTTTEATVQRILREGPKMYNSGGSVPGFGSGDTIPAMLEPGEFVIPKWMMETGFGDEIARVWSNGKKMASGGPAGFAASGGAGSFNAEGVQNHLDKLISKLDTTTQNVLGPISKFFSANAQDTGAVLELFTNLISLLSASEEAKVYFEDLIRDLEEIDLDPSVITFQEAIDNFTSTINDLLKGELVTAIRDLLGNIFGMNDEAGEAANSFNIPKLMKLTRAAWGAAIPGQSYDAGGGEEDTTAWERIANGIFDAVALLLGNIIWSEVIAKVIWADYISPLLSWMWETFIEGPAMWVWENILEGPANWVWENVIKGPAMWVWENLIVGPAMWVWENLIEGPAMWVWENVLEGPTQWVWENIIGAEILDGITVGDVALWATAVTLGVDAARDFGYWFGELIGLSEESTEFLADLSGIFGGALLGAMMGYFLGGNVGAWLGLAAGTIIGAVAALEDGRSDPSAYSLPGQFHSVLSTGSATIHKGEVVGTPPMTGYGNTYQYFVTLPNVTNAEEFAEEMERVTQMKNLHETGNRYGPYEA